MRSGKRGEGKSGKTRNASYICEKHDPFIGFFHHFKS